jgi:hypothetical protein
VSIVSTIRLRDGGAHSHQMWLDWNAMRLLVISEVNSPVAMRLTLLKVRDVDLLDLFTIKSGINMQVTEGFH